jgi:hypothetical protein
MQHAQQVPIHGRLLAPQELLTRRLDTGGVTLVPELSFVLSHQNFAKEKKYADEYVTSTGQIQFNNRSLIRVR